MKILYLINFAGKAGTEKYVKNLINEYNKKVQNVILHIRFPALFQRKWQSRKFPL